MKCFADEQVKPTTVTVTIDACVLIHPDEPCVMNDTGDLRLTVMAPLCPAHFKEWSEGRLNLVPKLDLQQLRGRHLQGLKQSVAQRSGRVKG